MFLHLLILMSPSHQKGGGNSSYPEDLMKNLPTAMSNMLGGRADIDLDC